MLPKLLTQVFERARTRLGLEVYILDSALTPIYPGADSDLVAAVAEEPRLRDALLSAFGTGGTTRVRMAATEFEAVPLRLGGGQRCIALVGLVGDRAPRRPLLEFWVDLVKSVWESSAAAAESLDQERARSRRLVAMLRFLRHIVETGSEAELAHAIVQAAAVWFDVDARIYQRDLLGDFVLFASLPGAAVDEATRRLSSLWVPASLELRRVSSPTPWTLPTGAELMLLPLGRGDGVDWVLALIGSAPEEEIAHLPSVGSIAGAHLESLRSLRRDRARARISDVLHTAAPSPDAGLTLALREIAGLTHAAAGGLTVNRRGRLRRLVTIGSMPTEGIASGSREWLFSADQFVCGWALGEGVTATLELRPAPEQSFTSDAAMLTRVGVDMLQSWMRGAEASLTDTSGDSQGHEAASAAFLKRIDEELERARRFDLRFSLVLVDLPRQGLRGDTSKRVEDALRQELRGSDVLGRVESHRVIALLTHTDASGSSRVVERLRRRLAESAAHGDLAGLTVGHAVFSSECRTAEALVSRAIRDAEPVAV
jgi:GGDEF domain-containing protein